MFVFIWQHWLHDWRTVVNYRELCMQNSPSRKKTLNLKISKTFPAYVPGLCRGV